MRRALMLLSVCASAAFAQTRTAIVGVDVLTMEDGPQYRRNQTVIINGERIADIGPSLAVPAGARQINGRGMVLMPGLMDMHVHLEGDPARWIGTFLGYGVTTVLNLRGNPTHLALRDSVKRMELLAPRIYTAGAYVNRPAIETEQDALRELHVQKTAGYDVLKIHGPLGNAAYHTLLDSARAIGMTVVGHAPRNLPFDSVIAFRQPMVAHAEELIYTKFTALDSNAIGDLPARMAAAHIWLEPTLSTFHGIATQWGRPPSVDSALKTPGTKALTEDLAKYWTTMNPYTGRPADVWANQAYAFQRPLVRALFKAGVRIMAGTDTPLPIMVPGASLHQEVEELRGVGLPNYDAIATATLNPGDFIRELIDHDMKIGRVAKGWVADLLLVSGDPLKELGAMRHPAMVITRGRVIEGARLAELRHDDR